MNLDNYDKEISRVESVRLGFEDHGILTMWVDLKFDKTSSQSFGGFGMDSYDDERKERIGHPFGTDMILHVLRCFSVSDINDIVGKPIQALFPKGSQKYSRRIIGLAPLPCDTGTPFITEDIVEFWKERLGD